MFSPHAPQDHALAVRVPQSSDPPLSEMGLCPVIGIFTVDDASFTTWAQTRSGSTATTTFPCVAPLNTGPPQTFIEGARRQLQTACANSPISDRISAPRSLGGFRTSALLRTPKFGEHALVQQSNRGAAVCPRDPSVSGTASHLGYADSTGVSRVANARGQPRLLLRCSCSHRPLPGGDASIR